MYCGKCGSEGHWYARCPENVVRAQNADGVTQTEDAQKISELLAEITRLERQTCPICEAKRERNRSRMKRKRDVVS